MFKKRKILINFRIYINKQCPKLLKINKLHKTVFYFFFI